MAISERSRILQAAIKAKRAGNSIAALEHFKSLEEQGERWVRSEIGYIYEHGGEGLQRDYSEAFRWYQKALIEDRDEWALVSLARMYVLGRGVSQDYKLARGLYAEAAERGNSVAQFQYAGLLFDGLGGERNREGAIACYEKAARAKNFFAMMVLAAYERSRGRYIKCYALRIEALVIFIAAYVFDRGSPRIRNM